MPFTLSHPAAVLPLLRGLRGRGPLVASGLVAGSMAPDVPFFAESWLPGAYRHGWLTHRWWAVPTLDVAIAGALVAAWHGAARRPLLGLLPDPWSAAALTATAPRGGGPEASREGWPDVASTATAQRGGAAGVSREGWPGAAPASDLAAFALSAAIGAASHVGWDAFTHEGRAGVRLLPALNRRVGGLPLYTVLQYGTSAAALGYLGRYLATELRQLPASNPAPNPAPNPTPTPGRRAGRAVIGLAAVLGARHRVARSAAARGPGGPHDLIGDVCFGAGAGVAAGALALAAWQRWSRPTVG